MPRRRSSASAAVSSLLILASQPRSARAPKTHGLRRVTPQGVRELDNFTAAFMRELEVVSKYNAAAAATSSPPRRVFLLDVGANDGRWSDQIMRMAQAAHPTTRVELVLVEPQRRFYATNQLRAQRWNGTFLPVAAWTEDASDMLFVSPRNSETASLASTQTRSARPRAGGATQRIKAIDFARYLLREVPPDGLAWLKMDVEGAEYAILPRLLVSGALCGPVRFLQIEWHLNNLPAEKRAEGLALRKALGGLIEGGCPRSRRSAAGAAPPARHLLHEEFRGTNFDIMVPGLMEEAVRHAMPCVSTQRCGWHPVNLTGNVEVQGVHYDARVFYYFAARFLTYINGVR